MRRYELMLLLRPDLEDDKLQAAVEKVTRAVVNAGGSLSKVSPWGKRRLAYDIARHREASYFLIHFDIEPSQVREIERGLLISEEILRHLVTVLEDRGPADEVTPAVAARGTDDEAPGDFSVAQDDEAPDGFAAPRPAEPAEEPVAAGDSDSDTASDIDVEIPTQSEAEPEPEPAMADADRQPAEEERAEA